MSVLYIFSGLPGSGKSTLAQRLAASNGAMYLRIDTVEQGLFDLCQFKPEGEGYRLSYRIAQDNLRLGVSVIADSCNPARFTREEWQQVATDVGADFIDIEISCSDKAEHQHRVETRAREVPNLVLPTWEKVQKRYYEPWHIDVTSIDTAGCTVDQSFAELQQKLASM